MIRFLQTPGPLKKVILGGLLTIICVFMVITLVPGFGSTDFFGTGGPAKGVVATVAGSDITTLEVQREAKQMVQQQFPRGGAQVAMLLPYFSSQAAQQLISRSAIIAEARRMGLHATDDDLRDELQHGRYAPVFFPEGKFVGQAAYEERLQQADLSVTQFEEGVKEDILLEKLRNLVAGSALVTDAEVHEKFVKDNTKVKFDYAVLHKEDILKTLHPADAELKAYYEQHKAAYANSIPEKRKIEYALIDSAKVQAGIQVNQQEIAAYYDQHRDEYRVPEQVNVRQILIKTPLAGADGKVDAKGVEDARRKGEEALGQLKAGAKFEDVAKKYSDDPSGKTGGSIGWVRRGGFPVPEVDKAAFSLAKGGNSDLINAGYAFVILHVDDKQEAHAKTLDEVKDQIEPAIKAQKASQAAEAEATALVSQSRSGGLDKAAAAKGLTVVTTDFINRSDSLPGIGNAPPLMEAVFNAAEKSPPDQLALPQGFVVYQLLAIKPPATPSFEDIRARVESEFKESRSAALLTQKTQELSDRAKSEHDLKKAAKELGATMKTSDLVLPDGQVPELGAMSGPASVAFTLKPGDISGPIDTNTSGVVLTVLEKQDPTDQDYAAKKDQIRDSLRQSKQQELFGLFVSNLRQQMEKSGKIKINQQELKSLTKRQGGEDEGE
ncbi:MAG TPA: peptidyl-prolyl cis-trans isomerase [Terriglobales bacterium]|jgi:peptidyl-prolyl cis-trans isomerase D|nr:peptidyl-prolyl cis-trans isomerase [Terriglobales bacterium]